MLRMWLLTVTSGGLGDVSVIALRRVLADPALEPLRVTIPVRTMYHHDQVQERTPLGPVVEAMTLYPKAKRS